MRELSHVVTAIMAIACVEAHLQAADSRWLEGSGEWQQATRWTQGTPDAMTRAMIGGKAVVTMTQERQVVGGLLVGTSADDASSLQITDANLIVRRGFVQIGEVGPGSGEVTLAGGAFHCAGPVYVGAANSLPDRNCRGALRIRGGSFAARLLTLGWGQGSEALLSIEGSKVESVHLLDYMTMGAYLEGKPSTATLAFTLDAHGVTPITIEGRRSGLTLVRGKTANRCQLRVSLNDVPPREDVPLIMAKAKTQGEFDGLPEGAVVETSFGGRNYAWTLTYRGGASGCDVVLTKPRGFSRTDAVSHARPVPTAPPRLLWTDVPLRPPLGGITTPAFEGAEGFGAGSLGGRGGQTLTVANLNDAGPGSLREALNQKGPRVIQFAVGGIIRLKTPLVLREPMVSVLGQTAPAPGITIQGHGMSVQTHDVILRHLRIRPGDESDDEDAIEFYDAERCIADHCSFGFGTDETCSIVGLSDAITIQYCIVSEGLNRKGHSMAAIAGGERTTWHHNLIAHCRTRNVRFADVAQCDFRNNVVYDWGDTAGYGQFERLNFVGNYYKPGPSTTQRPPRFHIGDSMVPPGTLYISDNILLGQNETNLDNWLGVNYPLEVRAKAPFVAPAVATEPASAAYDHVLRSAGAALPARDAVDTRIVRQVREGTGRIINTASEVTP
jgi:hypothetical protein